MEYRHLRDAQEIEVYLEMVRLAFNSSREMGEFWQGIDPITEENSRGLFDNEGKMLCGMFIIDGGALYMGTGRPITTALISAVASPPEQRRKGYIRELFEGMYAEQRAKGVALTALYPFYFPFYRSFGYELAHDAANYVVKMEQFKPWRKAAEQGRFVPIDVERIKKETTMPEGTGDGGKAGESELDKLRAIYSANAARRPGAVARTRRWWVHKFFHNKDLVPAYIYYNPEGRATGYLMYHFEDKGNWNREMVVHEMMSADLQTQEAIFGFLYNHDSQAEKINFWEPVDSALATRFPNPRQAEVKVEPGYMLRLLDVEGAFRQREFAPEAKGEFTFAVTDGMMPANNGVYRVRVSEGAAEVDRVAEGAAGGQEGEAARSAGLEMDERTLAQLYGGYLSPVRAAAIGHLKVSREADLLGMQSALQPRGQLAAYMFDDF
ncbi:MAG: enhanced intracellular survival protein Eis [Chloroflexia bacterium]